MAEWAGKIKMEEKGLNVNNRNKHSVFDQKAVNQSEAARKKIRFVYFVHV
jgi:hypothetical protein